LIYEKLEFLDMAVNVGDKAPDFELVDTELKMRRLGDFAGKKLVLSFFVAASSPVCTNEMCTFRDRWNEISGLGAQVIGISNDGPFANKAFAEKFNFNFPILGDYKSKTIRDYDILMPDLLHVKGYDAAKRSVFVVNGKGTIIYKWVSDNPLIEPNYQEIIDVLKKA
jgi:peroxiredoxin